MTGSTQLMRALAGALLLFSVAIGVNGQDEGGPAEDDPLPLTENLALLDTTGLFGEPVTVVRGELRNPTDDTAFRNIVVRAAAYDRGETLIGEGFGGAVDACRAQWVGEFTLAPGQVTGFDITLETYEDAPIERVDLFVDAEAVEPMAEGDLPDGIVRVDTSEVVEVEWITADRLRYASGCERLPFTEWRWRQLDVRDGRSGPTQHPRAAAVTPEMRERIRAASQAEFEHAFIRFAPDGDRVLYQDRVNTLLSASIEGQFSRQIQNGLANEIFNQSLQHILWGTDERFLAAYFGGYGDPVLYFTANAEGQRISPSPKVNRPSQIVPGISRDARRAVIAGEFDDGTGYYLTVFNNSFFEKLFDAEPPGNNYPAPLLIVDAESDLVTRVLVALDDDDGAPRLMCFNRETSVLHDLAALPFRVTIEERAAWWMSPDDATIALAANGINAGLWTIDLDALPSCD